MSGTINLGRVRPIYLGDYDPGRAYSVLERVKYNGHIYECAANTTAGIAPDSAENGSAYWTQISVDNAVPEPVWEGTELSWQYPDGTTTEFVDLQGPAGPQGVPGPVDITSDLTSTDPDVALSALGGKNLNDKIKLSQFNTKEIIEESGTYTAPVTGYYKVTCISGGQGGKIIYSTVNYAQGGDSGKIVTDFMFLQAGEEVPVTIGAGGLGNTFTANDTSLENQENITKGGETSFGTLTTNIPGSNPCFRGISLGSGNYSIGCGGGLGGGRYNSAIDSDAGYIPASWYGAGGASKHTGADIVKPGHNGAVFLEYNDPDKTNF